jgi:hypothetical protein
MGTSTSNKGQNGKTPLVPSWLDADLNDTFNPVIQQVIPDISQIPNTELPLSNNVDNPLEQHNPVQIPEKSDVKRFSNPRSNFTRFTNGGGRSKLSRAVSSYIKKSNGGSQNATKRLGSARLSTAHLFSVIGGFANDGINNTAKKFQLGDIVGKTATDVFLSVMNFICPDGGNTDEGIARSTYIDALSSMPDWDNKQIETLTSYEFLTFIKTYMTLVIKQRIINDIGNKMFTLPKEVALVERLEEQIVDFIGGAVSDSISELKIDIKEIESSQAQSIVDSVYKTAFDIMSVPED